MATLKAEAAALLKGLVRDYHGTNGGGSFSCAVYDTAWLSMVSKRVSDQEFWLFPNSFRYVLDSQQPDGSWESYASEFDGIMNTMAALLALCRHRDAHLQLGELMHLDIDTRICRAVIALRQRLKVWNVHDTLHVGYELIIPSLLRLLAEVGFTFSFPGQQSLMELHAQKLSRFDPASLYGEDQTAALHSLEAFIGTVDFDRLKHHTRNGGMMASPSSTAVYLQQSSVWDSDAEHYLCLVVSHGEGRGNGGVPSAFPTTNFEMIWVVSALLQGGFTQAELGCDQLSMFAENLESCFQLGNGLLGFASGIVPDADDTSQAIRILRSLNRPVPIEPMVKSFDAKDHFRTYTFERNPSFTVNCNVLTSLLSAEECLDDNVTQIENILRFLCDTWWNSDQRIRDKWNLSPQYPEMLLAQSSMRFLLLWDQGKIPMFREDATLLRSILIMLFQTLVRVLQAQNSDGSWGNRQSEPTAYAILALISLQPLPIANTLQPHLYSAIRKGREFLNDPCRNRAIDFIWIEKVTYHLKTLHQAYILAALNAPPAKHTFDGKLKDKFHLPLEKITKFKKFYQGLPLFAAAPEWLIEAALIESYLFLPQLLEIRLEIFPRRAMEEDKYFEYIPFTWTASNILGKAHYRASFLREMMIISFLNYQADEYMETAFSERFAGRLTDAFRLIDSLFDDLDPETDGCHDMPHNATDSTANVPDVTSQIHAYSNTTPLNGTDSHVELDMEVYQTLRRFIEHILCHPALQTASDYDKIRLRQELRLFLLAHVQQIEDSTRMFSQDTQQGATVSNQNSNRTFFDWVRTTSSDHTSCPYSFAFAICLLSDRQDFFCTSTDKYLGQAACRHLATLCRLYNDCGSLSRDRLEKNLNSLDFPEFHISQSPEEEDVLKETLLALAAFERKCLELTLGELESVSQQRIISFMRTFVNVTDMFGQIYVAKDIASRIK